MKIDKHSLFLIVKAARMALEFSEELNKVLYVYAGGKPSENTTDVISGFLCEALFRISGETTDYLSDFNNTEIMKLLVSDNSDAAVTDAIVKMYKGNYPGPEQPEPQTITASEWDDLYKENGGYHVSATPE